MCWVFSPHAATLGGQEEDVVLSDAGCVGANSATSSRYRFSWFFVPHATVRLCTSRPYDRAKPTYNTDGYFLHGRGTNWTTSLRKTYWGIVRTNPQQEIFTRVIIWLDMCVRMLVCCNTDLFLMIIPLLYLPAVCAGWH